MHTHTSNSPNTNKQQVPGTVTPVCLECCLMNVLKNIWVHQTEPGILECYVVEFTHYFITFKAPLLIRLNKVTPERNSARLKSFLLLTSRLAWLPHKYIYRDCLDCRQKKNIFSISFFRRVWWEWVCVCVSVCMYVCMEVCLWVEGGVVLSFLARGVPELLLCKASDDLTLKTCFTFWGRGCLSSRGWIIGPHWEITCLIFSDIKRLESDI